MALILIISVIVMAKSKTTEPEQTQSPSWVQWIKISPLAKKIHPNKAH